MVNRWWIYQKERFPVFAHGPLILAFSLSAMSYSAMLHGQSSLGIPAAGVAFTTAFLFFLQLRIADEFKDAEDDARWRPYRPVPRGLVKLSELGWIGALAGAIQLIGSMVLDFRLSIWLLVAWTYLALMSKEFFVHAWLKRHPAFYMLSHMLIMPVFDIYATACEWLPGGGGWHSGLGWFLAVSYVNGIVIEIGRKIRVPEDEEEGVDTYSALWGRPQAIVAWLAAMGLTALCAFYGACLIDFEIPVAFFLLLFMIWAGLETAGFLSRPHPGRGKRLELVSGVWTLVIYVSLGVLPLTLRAFGGVG